MAIEDDDLRSKLRYVGFSELVEQMKPIEIAEAMFRLEKRLQDFCESESLDFAADLWERSSFRIDDLGTWDVDLQRSRESAWRKYRDMVRGAHREVAFLLDDIGMAESVLPERDPGRINSETLVHSHLRLLLSPRTW